MKNDPPASGTRPMPTKPGMNAADSAAMRRSHAQASERPAPAHGPLTAAITGFSSARIASTFGWYVARRMSATLPVASLKSLQILSGAESAPRAGDDDRANLRSRACSSPAASAPCSARLNAFSASGRLQRQRQDSAVAEDLHFRHARSLHRRLAAIRRAAVASPRRSSRERATRPQGERGLMGETGCFPHAGW